MHILFFQNVFVFLTVCVLNVTGIATINGTYDGVYVVEIQSDRFTAVSLGEFILVGKLYHMSLPHERGHTDQARAIGPWYYLLIGAPSFITATLDIIVWKATGVPLLTSRQYYNLPWESWLMD